ncbi:MAG: SAM-dependent methyltransferase [Parachlamydiales bacterium]|jgi:16S rRNA (cytidine1402-2'-O)-methyltransferase
MPLILLPNLLDENQDIDLYFPPKLKTIIESLEGLIAENEKNARNYLFRFLQREEAKKINLKLLNEHTKESELKELIELIAKGNWGIISDAGLPCIADPGANLVKYARAKNIEVKAVSGPSSIFLALMLSGLNGQQFSFHGYLPREEDELKKKIKFLENETLKNKTTQIFIEAPYRSDKLLNILRNTLKDDFYLCIAISLTAKEEKVITKKIKEWKEDPLIIGKNPTVFLFNI